MTIKGTATAAAAVSVTTSATALDQSTTGGRSLLILNVGAQTVYVGGSAVTTAAGFPVAAGESLSADAVGGAGLYGIVAATTCEVRVLQVGRA